MGRFTASDSLAAIDTTADRLRIPRPWAEAIAHVEDPSLDPYAVGDNGTSFGIYQLHAGGELGTHSPAWAFDPRNNAATALGELARVIAANPGETDPGVLAAMAQRPFDAIGYAQKVDVQLQAAPAGSSSAGAQTTELAGIGGLHVPNPFDLPGDAAHAIAAPFEAIYNMGRDVWQFFTSSATWIRVGLAIGGFVLVLLGLKLTLGSSMPAVIPVPV